MSNKVVIFGTKSFAEVVNFYLKCDSAYEVVAFTATKDHIQQDHWKGLPLVPFEQIEDSYPPDKFNMFIAVGYTQLNKIREKFYHLAKEKGYKLITYINSKITCWEELNVGDNCFIFENQVIQPFVKIGNNVIIWSGNHIGHHVTIGDHCFITSHVVISGHVNIGSHCYLGVNSTIGDSVHIDNQCIIGAGAVVLKNTKEKGVYVGEQAKLFPKNSSYFLRGK